MRNSRKAILVLILLAAVLLAGVEYLNRVVLPVETRQWAEAAASRALGRTVTIGRLRVHLWHGFLLEKVSVLEDPRYGPGPLLEADQISGGILFVPIFRNRELIIPSLRIVRPRLHLIQAPNGRWDIEDLFPKQPTKSAARGKLGVLVPRITLTGGEIVFAPRRGSPPGPLRLSDLELAVGLSLPARAEWTASADLRAGAAGTEGAPPVRLSSKGTYTPQKDLLQAAAHVVIPLSAVPPHLSEATRATLLSFGGSLEADLELSGRPKGPFSLKGWMETQGLLWETAQPFSSGWVGEPPERLRGTGEIRARVDGEIPPLPSAEPWRGLRGVVTLDRLSAGPVPYAGEVREIAGEVTVDAQGIRAERVTAQLPSGLEMELSGSVLNDAGRTAGFRLTSFFPLEQMPALPAPWQALLQSLKRSGRVKVDAGASGALRPALSLKPTATITLENIGLELPDGRALSGLQGTLRVQPDLLTVTGLRGRLLEQPIELQGSLVDFGQPEINAELSWGGLSAQAEVTLSSDKVEIQSLDGRLGKGPFRVIGEIGRPEPEANLLAEATFHPEELASSWPGEPPAWLKQSPAKGEVTARLLVEGDLRRPADLRVELKASSPSLALQEIPLRQVSVDLRQEGGRVTLNTAQAEIAQGTLSCSGSLASTDPAKPWKGRLAARDVELAVLAEQLRWKTSRMSGKLQLDWEGGGRVGDLSSLSGPGTLQIHGAQILEVPLLGQFADFLSLPTLNRIAFQEAQGRFTLAQGQIQTENLTLTAPQATLTVTGSGGFLQGADSPIGWRVFPTLSPEIIPEETRSKIGEVLAKGASYLIGEVRVEGTWKSPKTRFVSKPITQVLGEQLGNLKDLLKDLF